MTAEQRIYEYLIQNGNTNAANAMNMAALGLWAAGQNINTGNKLSTFIRRFPQLFALIDNNKLIYAIPPNFQYDDDYDKTQGEGSLLSTNVPYTWSRNDFQSSRFVPHYPDGYNVAAIRALPPPRPLPPPPLPIMTEYNQGMNSPVFSMAAHQQGGKSKSKSRSARKSRTARKSRSRKNRNRRNKTARKY